MSLFKILGLVVALFATLIGATVLWIRSAANRRWMAIERETQALVLKARARDSFRPVLRGEAVEGNSWDDYSLAMIPKWESGVYTTLDQYVSRKPDANREAVEEILSERSAALEVLRRGVRRTHGQYPIDWDLIGPPDPFDAVRLMIFPQTLGYLAVSRARQLAEAGCYREAEELLLDTCQFARDVGHNSAHCIAALLIYSIALQELRDVVLSTERTPEALSQINGELATLDLSFPKIEFSLENELMNVGRELLKSGGEPDSGGLKAMKGLASAWRFGFSSRLMKADAFSTLQGEMTRAGPIDELPWSELVALEKGFQERTKQCRNPLVQPYSMYSMFFTIYPRQVRTQLRLLRVAAHYLATGDVLVLGDPSGSTLHTEKKGQTLRIWSAGSDEVDRGGAGDLKGNKDGPGSDQVLEVKR